MKNNNDKKIVIAALAARYNNIQTTQCDPLLDVMASLLKELYPKMDVGECMDYALEFVNRDAEDAADVFRMLSTNFK